MAKTVGQNISYDITKDNKLVITVDLNKDSGKSKSGKTIIIGTSQGNTRIKDKEDTEVVFGLNVYKYPDE